MNFKFCSEQLFGEDFLREIGIIQRKGFKIYKVEIEYDSPESNYYDHIIHTVRKLHTLKMIIEIEVPSNNLNEAMEKATEYYREEQIKTHMHGIMLTGVQFQNEDTNNN